MENTQKRLNNFKQKFKELVIGFEKAQELDIKSQIENSRKYNIFSVLGVERREVSTHSSFLANLLNPKGSHGQGKLFLEGFIDLLVRVSGDKFEVDSGIIDGEWRIKKEKNTPDGNLDIVISKRNKECLIVVENKIDANLGDEQLERYYKWIQDENSKFSAITLKNSALIFLTKYGEPAPYRAKSEAKLEPLTEDKYICISYHENIRDWLKGSLNNVKSNRMREILTQYIELIQNL
jgi:hypothetical protein